MAGATTAGGETKVPVGRRFSKAELVALITAIAIAFSSQMAMPLWIGALMDGYGHTASAVGFIAAAEMAAVALTSLGLAVGVHRLPMKPIVFTGFVLLAIGNFGGMAFHDVAGLVLFRVLVGCGKGAIATFAFSLIAGGNRPTRLFALVNASYMLCSVPILLGLPSLIFVAGVNGVFGTLGTIALLGSVVLFWFPERSVPADRHLQAGPREIAAFGFVAFAALMLMSIGHNAIWTFVQRLGLHAGLTRPEIGHALSLASLLAIFGPMLAGLIDMRFGNIKPILVAVLLDMVVVLLMVQPGTKGLFVALAPCLLLIIMFALPYFLGVLSAADPAGRLSGAASAALTIGHSIGALTGGWTIEAFRYAGLGWLATGSLMVVIGLTIWAAQLSRRGV